MKVKRRWIILMAAMTVIAAAGVFVGEPTFECDWSVISAADVAWLITATIFVLMMTPGLSFFYGGMVGAKNVISTMLQQSRRLPGCCGRLRGWSGGYHTIGRLCYRRPEHFHCFRHYAHLQRGRLLAFAQQHRRCTRRFSYSRYGWYL